MKRQQSAGSMMLGLPRRLTLTCLLLAVLGAVLYLSSRSSQHSRPELSLQRARNFNEHDQVAQLDTGLLTGHAIAPKLGNETAKAELGRAAWRLLHTVMARFPDEPTSEESAALKAYIHLFQRLYPCGECAEHFGQILAKFPPQTSSRSTAAVWACVVHNEVNKSLQKELFDCANIGDFYDCGCADSDEKE